MQEAGFAGTAISGDAGISSITALCRGLHSQDLPCSEKSEHVGTSAPNTHEQYGTLFYSYSLITSDIVLVAAERR